MSAKRHAARPTDRALRAAGNHRRRRGVPPDDLGPVLYVPSRLASRFEFREHFGCQALNKLRDLVGIGILPDLAARHRSQVEALLQANIYIFLTRFSKKESVR